MIQRKIPRDIGSYEPKTWGPFTTRQAICLVPAAILDIALYSFFKEIPGYYYILVLVSLPFLLLGWVKPYGLPFEKFLKVTFINNFLAPKTRKYKTFVELDNDKKKRMKYKKSRKIKRFS